MTMVIVGYVDDGSCQCYDVQHAEDLEHVKECLESAYDLEFLARKICAVGVGIPINEWLEDWVAKFISKREEDEAQRERDSRKEAMAEGTTEDAERAEYARLKEKYGNS